MVDRILATWREFGARLLESRDALLDELDPTVSAEERETTEALMVDQHRMVQLTGNLLESLKADCASLPDDKLGEAIVGMAASIYQECFELMAQDDEAGEGQAQAIRDLAKRLLEEVEAEANEAVEAATLHSRLQLRELPTDFPTLGGSEDPELEKLMKEVNKVSRRGEVLAKRVRQNYARMPELAKASTDIAVLLSRTLLTDASDGRFEAIERKYSTYRRLVEVGPELVGVGIDVWSRLPGISSLASLLLSQAAAPAIERRIDKRQEEASHSLTLAVRLLPVFALPFVGVTIGRIRLGCNRDRLAAIELAARLSAVEAQGG